MKTAIIICLLISAIFWACNSIYHINKAKGILKELQKELDHDNA